MPAATAAIAAIIASLDQGDPDAQVQAGEDLGNAQHQQERHDEETDRPDLAEHVAIGHVGRDPLVDGELRGMMRKA